MTTTIPPDAAAALAQDLQRIGVFFRMAVRDGRVTRLWAGVGDCEVGLNVEDPGSAQTYNGFGELTGVPQLAQLINGVADRVTFTLSGVSQRVLTSAIGEATDVKGAKIAMGVAIFGADWQLLMAPIWLWRGVVDYLTATSASGGEDNGPLRTVELSVGTLFTGRRRPGMSYFTDPDQQARSPGDKFCERAMQYSYLASKTWPRF